MPRIILMLGLAALATTTYATESEIREIPVNLNLEPDGQVLASPVTSIVRIRRLPDGSVEQFCDTHVAKKSLSDSAHEANTRWIELPRETER